VLSHIGQAIPCDCAGIMRLDEASGGSLLSACTEGQRGARSATSSADVSRLLPDDATRPWYRVEWAGTPPACLGRMSDAALTQALVFPVRINQRLDSLLILGYVAPPEPLDEIVAAGCSLTDRLAVAGSNIAWEEKLYHQGHYDALTDLPNRVLLRDRVEQALLRAEREKTSVAVLLIDLDNFKQINDSLGHSAGDALLIECARRLHAAARQSDTAARLGGDEFILLVPDLVSNQAAAWLDALASRLNTLLATPMVIADRLVTTPASIGIALYPVNASGFEDLLKMADAAMYASKRQQPGAYQFYSGDMNAAVRSRFELTQDLRAAIGNDELVLYYQPKVSASSGRIVGAEALVRWASPQRGLLPPGMFVPLLDEIGLGNWLGDWVMERACAQMAEWDRQGLPPIPVSVNIAPAQFREGRIIERLTAILNDHALPASRIELEILEATAATGSSEIHATLSGLRAMGVRIALDDFGTGYSSLVYLTQLPADILKLDRAFIGNLASDPRQRAIVQSIISLARALDFEIIAEGVEERAQMDLLAGMGCQLIQGYLISRPVAPEQFAELLRGQDRAGV
jgi:diguanylate cyclase (GGDEF)-like protein